jgi:hypothetical protein
MGFKPLQEPPRQGMVLILEEATVLIVQDGVPIEKKIYLLFAECRLSAAL